VGTTEYSNGMAVRSCCATHLASRWLHLEVVPEEPSYHDLLDIDQEVQMAVPDVNTLVLRRAFDATCLTARATTAGEVGRIAG
jgi:hypothetical protein